MKNYSIQFSKIMQGVYGCLMDIVFAAYVAVVLFFSRFCVLYKT